MEDEYDETCYCSKCDAGVHMNDICSELGDYFCEACCKCNYCNFVILLFVCGPGKDRHEWLALKKQGGKDPLIFTTREAAVNQLAELYPGDNNFTRVSTITQWEGMDLYRVIQSPREALNAVLSISTATLVGEE